jgi:hypothetical protein
METRRITPVSFAIILIASAMLSACLDENLLNDELKDTTRTQVVFKGETNGTLKGGKILGDMDGDGIDDFAMVDDGGSGPPKSEAMGARGAIYLFYGRPGFEAHMDVDKADAILRGAHHLSQGAQTCDVDGDGLNDLVYGGAYQEDVGYLVYGDSARLSGEHHSANIAITLIPPKPETGSNDTARCHCAGDLNGDEIDDIWVAQEIDNPDGSESHTIYIVLGRTDRLPSRFHLEGSDAMIRGSIDGMAVGSVAASPGDVDGDGYDELLIQVTRDGTASLEAQSRLFYGGPHLFDKPLSLSDTDAVFDWEQLATTMGFIGDLNGDGLADLSVSQDALLLFLYGSHTRFAGAYNDSIADVAVSCGTSALETFLPGLTSGDIDGDGLIDLIVGSPFHDKNGLQAGALYVVYGEEVPFSDKIVLGESNVIQYGSRLENDPSIDEHLGQSLGRRLSSGGDVNGDGLQDMIIDAGGSVIGDDFGGESYLRFGAPRQTDTRRPV